MCSFFFGLYFKRYGIVTLVLLLLCVINLTQRVDHQYDYDYKYNDGYIKNLEPSQKRIDYMVIGKPFTFSDNGFLEGQKRDIIK
ncbi:MAG TPA: hypothetical protein VD908_06920 [Cytophagales bacterium]|nr:hypothetical protein [Cytophagales bacterium]